MTKAAVALTQAMKFRATCLLVLCSLSAFSGDVKVATTSGPVLPSASNPEPAFFLKLDWNVEPAHWENLVGGDTAVAGPSAISDSFELVGPPAAKFDLSNGAGAVSNGTMKEADMERVLWKLENQDGLRLGQSDYVVRSPLLEGLIPRRSPPDASLGRKFLNLPIVRWFVPLPMPEPPGGGKYFKWGERAEPWQNIGQPALRPGALDNGM